MTNMYIKEINLISFGHFINKTLRFNKNFNLIYGENESGKSTIFDFIEGVFYGFDKGKNKINFSYKRDKYRPLGSYKYSGNIILEKDGKNYKIERNFDDGSYEIFDLDNNIKIDAKKSNLNYPGEFFLNLDYNLYQNIVNNQQIQKLSNESKEKLIEFLKNPSSDIEFSSLEAIENIENRLNKIGSKRAYTKPLAKNLSKLKEKENQYNEILNLRKNYDNDIKELENQRKYIIKLKEEISNLKKIRHDYRKSKAQFNYIEEKARKDSLDNLNIKLKNYLEFDDIDELFFERVDNLIKEQSDFYKDSISNKKSILDIIIANIFIIVSIFVIILISFIFKKYYFLFAIIVILCVNLYKKNDNKNYDKSLDDINYKIKSELIKIGAKNKTQYEVKKEKYREYQNLKIEKEKTLEILDILDKQEKFYDLSEKIENYDIDINELENEINNKEKKLAIILNKNLHLEKRLTSLEETISKENSILEDIKFTKKTIDNIYKEIEACNKAINIIKSLNNKFDDNKNLIENNINDIIRQISKGKYQKISYDKNLNPLIQTSNNEYIDIDKLSVGFYDQLNFALRFTISNNLFQNKFLLFDDAFINYDHNRLRMAILFLLDISKKFQIIYFTCHKREKDLLEAEGINVDIKILEKI